MDRAYYTPNLKLACFVFYLKIANNFFFFLKYNVCTLLSKELINGIEILVGQIVFKLWIKTVKNCFSQ